MEAILQLFVVNPPGTFTSHLLAVSVQKVMATKAH